MGLSAYLTETPDSPLYTGDKNGWKITRLYFIDNADVPAVLGEIPNRGSLSDAGDGYFDSYSIRHAPGYSVLSMEFTSAPDGPKSDFSRAVNKVKYFLSVSRIEKGLESAGGYRTKWNYNLYEGVAAADDAVTEPSWWTDATDFSEANGIDYVWAKSHPGTPKEGFWKLAKSMTKPGVEGYPVAAPTVVAQKYCMTEKQAIAFLRQSVGLADPGDRFGFAASSAPVYKWLAYPVGITNDGEFWIAENEYQFADSWDTDLYSVG